MPNIVVQPIHTDHWRGPKREWRSLHTKGDALGNTVHMFLVLDGPAPYVFAWREDRNAQRFGDFLYVMVPAPRTHRPDDATMWGAGTSVFFKLSTHANEIEGVRDVDEWRYEWPNVRTPWPNEPQGAAIDEPEGAHHAMAPAIESGGEPVDYGRIEDIVEDKLGTAVTGIVTNMVPKGVAALAKAFDKEEYERGDRDVRLFQDRYFARNDADNFLALNKHITGQDPNHDIENEGFKTLIKELMNEVLDEREAAKPKGGTK